jgi:hypothetical protein
VVQRKFEVLEAFGHFVNEGQMQNGSADKSAE